MISHDYASSSSGSEDEVEEGQHSSQLEVDSDDMSPPSALPSAYATAAFDDIELLEYEIIVDGEVVGTTHMTPAAARVAMPGSLSLNNNTPAAVDAGVTATASSPSSASSSACAACSATAPRYRCPGCSSMSCSLACVTAHKQQSGCTGKRPRSTYVPLHSFTASQLQHDLCFLEDVARNAHTAQRHTLTQHSHSHKRRNTHSHTQRSTQPDDDDPHADAVSPFSARDVAARYVALQRACVRLGVKLLVMPTGMKRHTLNTSVWNAREGRLCWHVEWLLDADKLSMHQSQVDGSLTWRAALASLLAQRSTAPQRAQRRERGRNNRLRVDDDSEQESNEERKEAEEVEDVGLVAAAAGNSEQQQRVVAHHSDPKLRLRLQRVTVIEFPSVHVAFHAELSNYPPYQPPQPHPTNTPQPAATTATTPQHPAATQHTQRTEEEKASPTASAVAPPFSSVPHMHPDRAVRAARSGRRGE